MNCPRCGFAAADGAVECPACGVVFARLEAAATAPPRRAVVAPRRRTGAATIATEAGAGRRVLAGLALAVVVELLPFARFVLSRLGTLVHELGHAAASWLLAIPALPAFDFVEGGGFTHAGERSTALALVLLAALAWLAWRLRETPRLAAAVAAVAAPWLVLVATGLDELAIVAAGHGSEILFAGIFLYRAWSGRAVRIPVERLLYAACGWFLVLELSRLTAGILADPELRASYEEGKGGAWHFNDMNRIADDFLSPASDPGRVDLGAVAAAYLALALATPLAAWWLHLHRDRLRDRVCALLAVSPPG
jgi:hypothetical protein